MNINHLSKAKDITLSCFLLVLANLSIYLLAYWTGSDRSWINVDYFIAFLCLAFGRRFLFALSFTIIAFFDFLGVFTQIFPFIRLLDIVYLLKFSFISSTAYKIYGIALVFFLILQIYVISKTYHVRLNKIYLVLFNIFVFLYAYTMNFGDDKNVNFWKPTDRGIVTSQLVNYYAYRNRGFIETYENTGEAFQSAVVSGASIALFDTPPANKILLVVNESWGVPKDDQIQLSVLKPVLEHRNVTEVQRGIITFKGFTLGGELRELCQKAPEHFNLKDQLTGFEQCLPHKYKKQGYETVAVHGALGLMYDRQDWYPRAGFNTLLFRDRGLNLMDSKCFSFPGNCDRDIGLKIVDQFRQNDKIFLYWLTLNTHAIYDERDLYIDLFQCGDLGVSPSSSTCRNLKLQKQYFYTLAQMIESGALSGTHVTIVGDHRPPSIKSADVVFEDDQVPYITFKVK